MEVTAEDLGKRSFCEAVMRARLPKAVFKELKKTIDYGAPLDAAIADSVAIAMREWAKELGATHYTHWFHPLTNLRNMILSWIRLGMVHSSQSSLERN